MPYIEAGSSAGEQDSSAGDADLRDHVQGQSSAGRLRHRFVADSETIFRLSPEPVDESSPRERTTMSNEARRRWGRVLLIIGRVLLASIFLIAGYAKVKPQLSMPLSVASVRTSLTLFAMQVDSYQMLPPWGVNAIAHVLPFFELFLGLWLLSGIGLRFSSVLSIVAFLRIYDGDRVGVPQGS